MPLLTYVCLYNYEFWLSLCKIVRSSVILLLPLLIIDYDVHVSKCKGFHWNRNLWLLELFSRFCCFCFVVVVVFVLLLLLFLYVYVFMVFLRIFPLKKTSYLSFRAFKTIEYCISPNIVVSFLHGSIFISHDTNLTFFGISGHFQSQFDLPMNMS